LLRWTFLGSPHTLGCTDLTLLVLALVGLDLGFHLYLLVTFGWFIYFICDIYSLVHPTHPFGHTWLPLYCPLYLLHLYPHYTHTFALVVPLVALWLPLPLVPFSFGWTLVYLFGFIYLHTFWTHFVFTFGCCFIYWFFLYISLLVTLGLGLYLPPLLVWPRFGFGWVGHSLHLFTFVPELDILPGWDWVGLVGCPWLVYL